MIDWGDSSGSSGSDEESSDDTIYDIKPVSSVRESTLSSSRSSMKGLQAAIAEGWLMQRARDMCSFAHDRYRQAAIAEAEKLPQETIEMMKTLFRNVDCVKDDTDWGWLVASSQSPSQMRTLRTGADFVEYLEGLIHCDSPLWLFDNHARDERLKEVEI